MLIDGKSMSYRSPSLPPFPPPPFSSHPVLLFLLLRHALLTMMTWSAIMYQVTLQSYSHCHHCVFLTMMTGSLLETVGHLNLFSLKLFC